MADNLSDDADDLLESLDRNEPRPHHYLFAHRALPSLLWQKPELVIGILLSDKAGEFLRDFWESVGEQLDPTEIMAIPDQLTSEPIALPGGHMGIAITIPDPQFVTEAYLTAIVFRPLRRRFFVFKTEPVLRYFTLEFGYTEDPTQRRTVFGEWTSTTHSNYGTGPTPTVAEFAQHIRSVL